MAPRLRIGLTGGIASGKSTVAQRFEELMIPVIDADDSARRVVALGQPGLAAVVQAFGAGVVTSDGALDRRALRNLVFSDPQQRKALESLLHPLIRADMETRAQEAPGPYLVLAIPLLIEGDYINRRLDRILLIDVPVDVQIARVMARDATTAEEARAIIAAQASREARLLVADDVVSNNGSVAQLRQETDRLHQQYLAMVDLRNAGPHI